MFPKNRLFFSCSAFFTDNSHRPYFVQAVCLRNKTSLLFSPGEAYFQRVAAFGKKVVYLVKSYPVGHAEWNINVSNPFLPLFALVPFFVENKPVVAV